MIIVYVHIVILAHFIEIARFLSGNACTQVIEVIMADTMTDRRALLGETRFYKIFHSGAGAPPVRCPWCNRTSRIPPINFESDSLMAEGGG